MEDDDDENDRTLIAAPLPAGRPHGPAPEEQDGDETLIAIPRNLMRAGLPPATPPPPRPAAGYPAPRPAAGYPAPRPAAGLPPPASPPMRRSEPPASGFVASAHTLEMPKVTPPAYVPRPLPPPPSPALQAVMPTPMLPPPPPPLPPPSSTVVLAAPEGMPAVVVRFILACGLVAVLGLLALIYLQL